MGRFPSPSYDHRGDVSMAAGFLLPGFPSPTSGQTIFLAFAYLFLDLNCDCFILPVSTVAWLDRLAYLALLRTFLANKVFIMLVYPIISYSSPKISCIRSNRKSGCPYEGRERKIRGRSFHTCSVCGATDVPQPGLPRGDAASAKFAWKRKRQKFRKRHSFQTRASSNCRGYWD